MNKQQREKIDALVETATNTNDPIEREAAVRILTRLDPTAVQRVYQAVRGKEDLFASIQMASILEEPIFPKEKRKWWQWWKP